VEVARLEDPDLGLISAPQYATVRANKDGKACDRRPDKGETAEVPEPIGLAAHLIRATSWTIPVP
jgi:hypothetical protein